MAKFVSIKLELFMNGALNAYEDRSELLEPLMEPLELILELMLELLLGLILELMEPLLAFVGGE